MAGISFCFLPGRGVLAITGVDRRIFLQGLVSNNVDKVSAKGVMYAALLTPQGKFLHEFFVAEVDEVLLLETELARLEDLNARLARFRLRARVTLTVEEEMTVAVAFGANASAVLGLAVEKVRRLARLGIAYVDPRRPEGGVRLMGRREVLEDVLHASSCSESPLAAYERLRLAHGLPDGSRDIAVERAGLLECGFEELNGVDFNKGCYVGQEVTTRSRYRGLVKKRLVPVVIDGPIPAPGTVVMLDDREVGEMRSAIEDIGLALIRLEAVERAQRTRHMLRAGSTQLTPRLPVWATSVGLQLPGLSEERWKTAEDFAQDSKERV